jgi:iron complex outermembrane receptor protein
MELMGLSKGLLSAAAGTVAMGTLISGVAAGAETSASAGDLQEIVVTAEKVAEDVTKTPIAMSVFSGEQLENQGVVDINQLQNVAPSVNIGSVGRGPYINIRGVYSSDITSKGEQAVSFNADGIAIGVPQIMTLAFLDVDHIEVLRGPQGTLYGKSSTAGAINVISAKPTDKFDASASLTYGNYDTRRTEAMVNVPVSDSFALRLAAASNNRDGYVQPVLHDPVEGGNEVNGTRLGDEHNVNARLSALWKFSDSGSLLLQAMGGEIGGTGEQSASVLYSRYSTMSTSEALKVYYNPYDNLGIDDHYGSIHGELNVDLGAVHLTYSGGYLRFTTHDSANPSVCDPLAAGCSNAYSFSNYNSVNTFNNQELRISNANPQRLEYVAGANYINQVSDEHDINWQNQAFAGPNALGNYGTGYPACPAAPNSIAACNNPNPSIVGPTAHKAEGVFGQVNFHLTDEWKLTGGLRWSSDSMYRHATISAGPAGGFAGYPGPGGLKYYNDINGLPCHPGEYCVPITSPGNALLNDYDSESASKVTWRVGVEDQFTPTQMLYASIATGYKAGSFNDFCPNTNPPGGCSYGPEDMTAYELGYKGKILPSLEVDTDVYYYDYSKFQFTQPTLIPQSANGVIIYTTLVPLTMYGWEGELHWNVTENDKVNLSATVANGYYGKGTKVGFLIFAQTDANGRRVDMLPPFSFNASYEHDFPLEGGANVSARLSSKISSGYYISGFGGDPTSTTRPYQKPFTLTSFDLTYSSASGKWDMGAFVRNIENKMQMLGAPGNDGSLTVTAPMTTGVRVSMHY